MRNHKLKWLLSALIIMTSVFGSMSICYGAYGWYPPVGMLILRDGTYDPPWDEYCSDYDVADNGSVYCHDTGYIYSLHWDDVCTNYTYDDDHGIFQINCYDESDGSGEWADEVSSIYYDEYSCELYNDVLYGDLPGHECLFIDTILSPSKSYKYNGVMEIGMRNYLFPSKFWLD